MNDDNFKYDIGTAQAKKRKQARPVKPLSVECTNCPPRMILKDGTKKYPNFPSHKALMRHNHKAHSQLKKLEIDGTQKTIL